MPSYYDNTRISAFKKCPRFYYFRHVRHWAPNATAVPLAFGGAWHMALETVWPMMCAGKPQKETIAAGYAAFVQDWVARGMPHPDDMGYEREKEFSPRTPAVAFEMLCDYVANRASKTRDLELISVERPFIVPLDSHDDSRFYVGKIDKVVRQRGKVRAIEHKTTTAYKKDGGFRATFVDGFSPNSQVDGYLYALHMLWPGSVQGVWVDAALVHKTETAFMFIPVEKQKVQLDSWLWETNYWIDQIQAHTAQLDSCSPSDPFLASFPKQTGSCQDFNKNCEYHDLCRFKPNPMELVEPPAGFTHEFWDPLHETGADKLVTMSHNSK